MKYFIVKPSTEDIEAGIFPPTLRSRRRQLGHTQREVGAYLGVSDSQYSRIERGDTDLPARLLVRLCRLFCVSADTMLGLDYDATARLQQPMRHADPADALYISKLESAVRLAHERQKAREAKNYNAASESAE